MDPHSIVVVSLHTPKEKIWGELLAVSTAGVTLRGIDLNSFDHFIRQLNEPDGAGFILVEKKNGWVLQQLRQVHGATT